MANFFNVLNQSINTIQKLDRIMTEKPEKPKVKYITKRFTEEEIEFLFSQLCRVQDFENTDREDYLLKKLKNKLNNKL